MLVKMYIFKAVEVRKGELQGVKISFPRRPFLRGDHESALRKWQRAINSMYASSSCVQARAKRSMLCRLAIGCELGVYPSISSRAIRSMFKKVN